MTDTRRELESTDDVRETSCVVVGGGQAGAALALLLSRSGVRVRRLESYDDFGQSFDRDTVHPVVMEVLRELGFAGGRQEPFRRELALTLPTLLVVPATQTAFKTAKPTALEGPAKEGDTGEAMNEKPRSEPPAESSAERSVGPASADRGVEGEETEQESQFELGRAQGRIELLEQELRRREQEISNLRNR